MNSGREGCSLGAMVPYAETGGDEAGPSGTQQKEEETTPDPKGKGKYKVTPKTRTKK
jgi:hypothetical protein